LPAALRAGAFLAEARVAPPFLALLFLAAAFRAGALAEVFLAGAFAALFFAAGALLPAGAADFDAFLAGAAADLETCFPPGAPEDGLTLPFPAAAADAFFAS
jgi:hypothetical protein